MNAMRMVEIALELRGLYEKKAELEMDLWSIGKDISAQEIAVTPIGSDYTKLGSNEPSRKAAVKQLVAQDETIKVLSFDEAKIKADLAKIEATMDGLCAERRGLEWATRCQLVEKLTLAGVQSNHRGDPESDVAFDDTADQATQETMDEWMADNASDEIPF